MSIYIPSSPVSTPSSWRFCSGTTPRSNSSIVYSRVQPHSPYSSTGIPMMRNSQDHARPRPMKNSPPPTNRGYLLPWGSRQPLTLSNWLTSWLSRVRHY